MGGVRRWDQLGRGERAGELFAVAGLRALISLAVIALGFSHISDDDFSRTVIAQGFAAHPRLDPSGTSWLPFPFWITGGNMIVFGRSLLVARVSSVALSAFGAMVFYRTLRKLDVQRLAASSAVVIAIVSPWNVWTGAAMVPEGFVAPILAAAALSLASPPSKLVAGALLCAGLSRYEAWPIVLVFSLAHAVRWLRAHLGRDLALALVPAAGPLAWMAWNAYAHGDAVHFFARVARYRAAHGTVARRAVDSFLVYPKSILFAAPELAGLAVFVVAAVLLSPGARKWIPALLAILVGYLFLSYGELSGGAPTHHPERAILAVLWVMSAIASAEMARLPRWGSRLTPALASACILLAPTRAPFPGQTPEEDRSQQLAQGAALRTDTAARFRVTPCAFEHFALVAAFGYPERVEIVNAGTGKDASEGCPSVERLR